MTTYGDRPEYLTTNRKGQVVTKQPCFVELRRIAGHDAGFPEIASGVGGPVIFDTIISDTNAMGDIDDAIPGCVIQEAGTYICDVYVCIGDVAVPTGTPSVKNCTLVVRLAGGGPIIPVAVDRAVVTDTFATLNVTSIVRLSVGDKVTLSVFQTNDSGLTTPLDLTTFGCSAYLKITCISID